MKSVSPMTRVESVASTTTKLSDEIGPQADGVCRVRLARPVPVRLVARRLRLGEMYEALLREDPEDLLHALAPEHLGRAERQLERGALDVREQDLQVVRVDQRVFGRRVEEVRRVADDVLVERRAARHQHRGRLPRTTARAAGPLPRGRDRARVAGQHRDVERADVDTELERARGDDRAHLAVAQPLLDLPAPVRQIAAPIPPHHIVRARRPLYRVLQVARQDLGDEPALREHDDLQAAPEELQRHPPRFLGVRPADAELLVDDGRVDEEEVLLAARRAALLDQLERPLGEPLGQLLRIGNRRRRAHEDRVGPVVAADAAQPPQHVREVAAEDPAVGVQLVDDDEAEVLEQAGPLGVMRQDPRVQHVGIRQHHLRPRADGAPGVLRRVAIVGEDTEVEAGRLVEDLRQPVELGQLVLRQRLGRKQIQRPRGRIAQDGVQDGDVVAERLAGRRRRGDDHALPRQGVRNSGRLVRVEPGDAAARERLDQARVDAGRHRRVLRVRRRHPPHGGDDLVGRVGVFPVPRRHELMKRRLQRLLAGRSALRR